jgi:hypothetical protein
MGTISSGMLKPPASALAIGAAFAALTARGAGAQAEVARSGVAFGAFADAYYAWDAGSPPDGDRWYTTQPARSNEFNVNLAFLEARLDGDRVRGRVALQAGTSVQANYAAEPDRGEVSGPDVVRFIQEAVAGVRVGRELWLDAGIFFSHIGQENWISRDNPTYTRSLTADYTPYYSAGVRATWQALPKLRVRADLVNGWQVVSENNADKSGGVRIEWQAAPRVLLGYDNFIGNEQPDSLPATTRVFNELFAAVRVGERAELRLTANLGVEGGATWYSLTAIGRQNITEAVAVSARVERFADPDQVVVVSRGAEGFATWGASIGVDVVVARRALWRSEARGFAGDSDLFPDGAGPLQRNGAVLVTSLALTL